MAYRYEGPDPEVENWDGHMLEVEAEGDDFLLTILHPPTCVADPPTEDWPVPVHRCVQGSMADDAGITDALGAAYANPDEPDPWPDQVPRREGRWPLGWSVSVFSHWEYGDEVDVHLHVATVEPAAATEGRLPMSVCPECGPPPPLPERLMELAMTATERPLTRGEAADVEWGAQEIRRLSGEVESALRDGYDVGYGDADNGNDHNPPDTVERRDA